MHTRPGGKITHLYRMSETWCCVVCGCVDVGTMAECSRPSTKQWRRDRKAIDTKLSFAEQISKRNRKSDLCIALSFYNNYWSVNHFEALSVMHK